MAAVIAAPVERLIDASDGTPEQVWLPWLEQQAPPVVAPEQLVPPGARAVIAAPHPDDEILAVGGLWAQLAQQGCALCLIALTDGAGSHPRSTQWPAERLAQVRPRETGAALSALGASSTQVVRLHFEDGRLAHTTDRLRAGIANCLQPGDVLFTTWRLDGHPDHDAAGAACAEAAAQVGATLVEVPVWAWHWAVPADARVPWQRARRIALNPSVVQKKQAALQAFASQLLADASTGEPAVLRPSILQRAARPFELVFS